VFFSHGVAAQSLLASLVCAPHFACITSSYKLIIIIILCCAAMVLQAESLLASLVCAPHFACITSTYKLVGAVLGFAYSTYWIVFYVVGAVNYESTGDVTVSMQAIKGRKLQWYHIRISMLYVLQGTSTSWE
jgi:hypothetical protein